MVTYGGVSKTDNDYKYEFEGLPTDTKPTNEDYPDMKNGSTFFEMDTQSVKFWDAENEVWV
jgi:hypothetical protein